MNTESRKARKGSVRYQLRNRCFIMVAAGKVRLAQETAGKVRLAQEKAGKVRLAQEAAGKVRLAQVAEVRLV